MDAALAIAARWVHIASVIVLLGGLPLGVYQGQYGPHFGGGLGLVLVVLLVLLLLGRI